jgi:hypothetical protein
MTQPLEARSGLDPWRIAELPRAPRPRGLGWFSALGPGVIALGVSIGSGEFLLGPAAFVKYGLSLLWVVGVAALLQTLLNVELMRYTLATGEPIVTGFMRTPPHSSFWAWFYASLYFLQMGWPGWAGADFFLLGAFAAYAGGGGVANLTLSNWARDKGYGMSSIVGFIPAAVGGKKVALAHSGSTFNPDAESLERWRGWWRIVRVDQWGVYFVGAILGMALPALLYVTFVPAGSDIRGLGIAAALAQAVATQKGAIFGGVIAVLGVWLLFKTQLDILEAMTRGITDILWAGSARIRAWRGGDVRVVYYSVLAVISVWGILALRLTQPIILLALSANMAGIVFIISSIHLLYVNTRLLPVALRPPMWRRLALVALALFYGMFLTLWLWSLVSKS